MFIPKSLGATLWETEPQNTGGSQTSVPVTKSPPRYETQPMFLSGFHLCKGLKC